MTPAQAARAQQVDHVHAALLKIEWAHTREYTAAAPPSPVQGAVLPGFPLLLAQAEKRELRGTPRFDRAARREARARARTVSERWALDLLTRAEADCADLQREQDSAWAALLDNDEDAVRDHLDEVFRTRNRPVTVSAVRGDQVTVQVVVPGVEVIPESRPARTPSGAPTLKRMTKTELADWVRTNAASHALLAVKEVLAEAPGMGSVRVLESFVGGPPILAATVSRAELETADSGQGAWQMLESLAPDLTVKVKGRTRELYPIGLDD